MNRSLYTGLQAIEAPQHIREALLVRGGTNPYGEPMYRLVRCEGRKRFSTGKWHEWAPGTPLNMRNVDMNRPWRSYVGTKAVPMYPGEHGWVLEKWMSPAYFGRPEMWERPRELGGTLRLIDGKLVAASGGYPHYGDYLGTNYIFPSCKNDLAGKVILDHNDKPVINPFGPPSEALLMNAIGRMEHFRDGLPTNFRARMDEETKAAQFEAEQEERHFDQQSINILGDENVMDVHSLGARAEVCRLAESIGIREHPF